MLSPFMLPIKFYEMSPETVAKSPFLRAEALYYISKAKLKEQTSIKKSVGWNLSASIFFDKFQSRYQNCIRLEENLRKFCNLDLDFKCLTELKNLEVARHHCYAQIAEAAFNRNLVKDKFLTRYFECLERSNFENPANCESCQKFLQLIHSSAKKIEKFEEICLDKNIFIAAFRKFNQFRDSQMFVISFLNEFFHKKFELDLQNKPSSVSKEAIFWFRIEMCLVSLMLPNAVVLNKYRSSFPCFDFDGMGEIQKIFHKKLLQELIKLKFPKKAFYEFADNISSVEMNIFNLVANYYDAYLMLENKIDAKKFIEQSLHSRFSIDFLMYTQRNNIDISELQSLFEKPNLEKAKRFLETLMISELSIIFCLRYGFSYEYSFRKAILILTAYSRCSCRLLRVLETSSESKAILQDALTSYIYEFEKYHKSFFATQQDSILYVWSVLDFAQLLFVYFFEPRRFSDALDKNFMRARQDFEKVFNIPEFNTVYKCLKTSIKTSINFRSKSRLKKPSYASSNRILLHFLERFEALLKKNGDPKNFRKFPSSKMSFEIEVSKDSKIDLKFIEQLLNLTEFQLQRTYQIIAKLKDFCIKKELISFEIAEELRKFFSITVDLSNKYSRVQTFADSIVFLGDALKKNGASLGLLSSSIKTQVFLEVLSVFYVLYVHTDIAPNASWNYIEAKKSIKNNCNELLLAESKFKDLSVSQQVFSVFVLDFVAKINLESQRNLRKLLTNKTLKSFVQLKPLYVSSYNIYRELYGFKVQISSKLRCDAVLKKLLAF